MISSEIIKNTVLNLCVKANTVLCKAVYDKIVDAYKNETNSEAKEALCMIIQNANLSTKNQMPLCQDTGQVVVFVKCGTNVPSNIKEIINSSVKEAYNLMPFRKSIVNDAVFDRTNTKTNTPCVIHFELEDRDTIEVSLLVKGGGSENVCSYKMLSPTASEDDIVDYVVSAIKDAGAKGCPPYFLGLGIGGTMDYAAILSKKALLLKENITDNHKNLSQKIQNAVNDLKIGAAGLGGNSTCLDVKILTEFTHIASMPVALTVNCHSSRHYSAVVSEDSKVEFSPDNNNFEFDCCSGYENYVELNSNEVEKFKNLKTGQNVLLSGTIYTARDQAHKRLVNMISDGEELPFDIKDKIIFYSGPCPCIGDCVVGSIGPTTASRMDKFTKILYEKGLLATIGKGERSEEVRQTIREYGGVYFSLVGGIACLLSEKFIKKELIAFDDLGAEAIYKFEIENLPLRVEIC